MSYRAPEYPSPTEDLRLLREFLRDLETVLQAVVDHPEGIVPGRLHERLRLAWPRVEENFRSLHESLTPGPNGPDADLQATLRTVGLTGESLAFELAVFNYARDRLRDHAPRLFEFYPSHLWISFADDKNAHLTVSAAVGPGWWPWRKREKGESRGGWWEKLRGFLKRCLKSGDVLLGSLGKIPVLGLPAEAIKQCKEGVEEAVAITKGVGESRWE